MFELPLALVLIYPLSLLEGQWVSAHGNAQVIFEKYKEAVRLKSEYKEKLDFWSRQSETPNWYLRFLQETDKRIEIWSLVDDVIRIPMTDEMRIAKHKRLKELLGEMYYSGVLPDTFPEGFPWIAPIPPENPIDDN